VLKELATKSYYRRREAYGAECGIRGFGGLGGIERASDIYYTTPRIAKVTIAMREQSQKSSYFEALLDPKGRGGTYFQLKYHAYYILYSIFNININTALY